MTTLTSVADFVYCKHVFDLLKAASVKYYAPTSHISLETFSRENMKIDKIILDLFDIFSSFHCTEIRKLTISPIGPWS